MGPTAAVFSDHVELSDRGDDFASGFGTGGVPSTKFIWQPSEKQKARLNEVWDLPPDKETLWKKWFDLYRDHRISDKEYLNLYDVAFDSPEAHVIRDQEALYYAFYQDTGEYSGPVSLRGLKAGIRYQVVDYVNNLPLGNVDSGNAVLNVRFNKSLLIKASPIP